MLKIIFCANYILGGEKMIYLIYRIIWTILSVVTSKFVSKISRIGSIESATGFYNC